MNIHKTYIAYLIPLLVTIHGCPELDFSKLDLRFVTVAHPLVDPSKSIAPDELSGTFMGKSQASYDDTETDNDEFEISSESFRLTPFCHVGRAGGKYPDGFLHHLSVGVPHDSKGTLSSSSEIFFVAMIGTRYIAHMPIVNGEFLSDDNPWDASKCDEYLLFEIQLTDDSFELKHFNLEFLDELIESKTLNIESDDGDTRLITNTAESLTEIFTTYGDKLFDTDSDKLIRVKRRRLKIK